ncbi:MAG: mechanosensitive ion channel family protein [Chloroflexi bacterium]|nr:mechanosensitive ion channel family protein [Chloroflexota bacterium]
MPEFDFYIDGSALVASLLRVLLILFMSWFAHLVVTRATRKAVEFRIPRLQEETRQQLSARARTVSGALNQVVKVVLVILALLAILAEFGIQIAPMLGAVGVVGLALGFAAQGIVRDYIHGMFLLIEDWYRVGEWVKIDGEEGTVEELSLRRTMLRNSDGTRIIIPNSMVTKASNMARDWSRLNMNVPVAYETDVEKAFAAINLVGRELKADETWGPSLLTAPVAVRVNNLGDPAIEIRIMGDTKPGTQWGVSGEFRKRLLAQFEIDGIEIAFPHVKVYFGDRGDNPGSVPLSTR